MPLWPPHVHLDLGHRCSPSLFILERPPLPGPGHLGPPPCLSHSMFATVSLTNPPLSASVTAQLQDLKEDAVVSGSAELLYEEAADSPGVIW